MFDSANLDHRIEKAAYAREEARLRQALLTAQYDLKVSGRFPVLNWRSNSLTAFGWIYAHQYVCCR